VVHARLDAQLALAGDVDLGRGVVADEDRGQRRRDGQRRDLLLDGRADRRGERGAVHRFRVHVRRL
jgi:hypothetical protein